MQYLSEFGHIKKGFLFIKWGGGGINIYFFMMSMENKKQ